MWPAPLDRTTGTTYIRANLGFCGRFGWAHNLVWAILAAARKQTFPSEKADNKTNLEVGYPRPKQGHWRRLDRRQEQQPNQGRRRLDWRENNNQIKAINSNGPATTIIGDGTNANAAAGRESKVGKFGSSKAKPNASSFNQCLSHCLCPKRMRACCHARQRPLFWD